MRKRVLIKSVSAGLLAAVLAAVVMPLRWGMMEGLGWWFLFIGLGTALFTAAYEVDRVIAKNPHLW